MKEGNGRFSWSRRSSPPGLPRISTNRQPRGLAADTVRSRLAAEPGVVNVAWVREVLQQHITFVTDKEKAALNGIATEQMAGTF